MTQSRATLFLLLALVPVATQSHAQLEPNQRVRITAEVVAAQLAGRDAGPRLVGTLVAIDEQKVVVRLDGRGEDSTVPRAAITRIEVGHSQYGKGALVGAAVGAAVFVGLGLAYCSSSNGGCASPNQEVYKAGLAWSGLGALIGTFAGGRDHWEPVELDRVRITLSPRRGGLGLSASIGF